MVGTDRRPSTRCVGFVYDLIDFAETTELIGAQTLLCLFMRTLNVGPAGNGERVRLIAHLGFALFDTNRGRPTANIRPTLRGFLLVSAVALTSCGLPTQGRLQEWVIRQSDPSGAVTPPTASTNAGSLPVPGGPSNHVLVR